MKIIKELTKIKSVLLKTFRLKSWSTRFVYTLTLTLTFNNCVKIGATEKVVIQNTKVTTSLLVSFLISQKYLKSWFILRSIILWANKDTQHALLKMIETWRSMLSKGIKVWAILIDFSKAFDNFFPCKLKFCGFDTNAVTFS